MRRGNSVTCAAGVATIALGHGFVALVDETDLPVVIAYTWTVAHRGRCRKRHYAVTRCDGRVVSLHRMLAPQWAVIDHRNTNGLDCRRNNLREATTSQNVAGQQKQLRPTSSQYKGVHWSTRQRGWRAEICHEGRRHWLGVFQGEQQAALAYNAAARRLFGEFARPNDVAHAGGM
jgi:hypothetical protein